MTLQELLNKRTKKAYKTLSTPKFDLLWFEYEYSFPEFLIHYKDTEVLNVCETGGASIGGGKTNIIFKDYRGIYKDFRYYEERDIGRVLIYGHDFSFIELKDNDNELLHFNVNPLPDIEIVSYLLKKNGKTHYLLTYAQFSYDETLYIIENGFQKKIDNVKVDTYRDGGTKHITFGNCGSKIYVPTPFEKPTHATLTIGELEHSLEIMKEYDSIDLIMKELGIQKDPIK